MGFVSSCWADLDLWKPQEFEVSTPPRALCLLLPGARDTAELGQGHCLPVPGLHRESPRHLLFLTCCYLECFQSNSAQVSDCVCACERVWVSKRVSLTSVTPAMQRHCIL